MAATHALDRVLTTGRYVIPVWHNPVSHIAHVKELKYPAALPVYGDFIGWMPTSGGTRSEAMKRVIVLGALMLLAACNTVAGVGEDISGAARTVQETF